MKRVGGVLSVVRSGYSRSDASVRGNTCTSIGVLGDKWEPAVVTFVVVGILLAVVCLLIVKLGAGIASSSLLIGVAAIASTLCFMSAIGICIYRGISPRVMDTGESDDPLLGDYSFDEIESRGGYDSCAVSDSEESLDEHRRLEEPSTSRGRVRKARDGSGFKLEFLRAKSLETAEREERIRSKETAEREERIRSNLRKKGLIPIIDDRYEGGHVVGSAIVHVPPAWVGFVGGYEDPSSSLSGAAVDCGSANQSMPADKCDDSMVVQVGALGAA